MTRQEELQIIRRVQKGGLDAFELLVIEHQKNVYNLALKMTGNEQDALDMSQEAFIKAFNGIGGFKGESKFSVWLYRLTSNLCIDFLRRKKRRDEISMTLAGGCDDEQLQIADTRLGPESETERQELREAVASAFSQLPDEYRQILTLREINGLSYDELADLLGLELGTVKSRLFRARKRICHILISGGNISEYIPSEKTKEV